MRDQALHALGDGSPSHLEENIVARLEDLYNDPHPDVKKKARWMLNAPLVVITQQQQHGSASSR